jgi:NNP family nitrate/nitrite transporter-like MFS transporter
MPFRAVLGTVVFMTLLFFLTFVSRFIFGPLLPAIREDMDVGSGQAGSLFLLGGLGVLAGSVTSGLVSSRIRHRGALALSLLGMALALVGAYFSGSLWGLRAVFVVLGLLAGMHMPSSVATVTAIVRPEDWGKALAVHQLAPPLSLVAGPLIAVGLLTWFSWNEALLWIAGVLVVSALCLLFIFGGIGAFSGDPPTPSYLRPVARTPSFWVMIFLFALGMGAQVGVYTMLPLYLTEERGFSTAQANTYLGLANIVPLITVFAAGWVTTRLGARKTMGLFLSLTGVMTVLVGLLSGPALVVAIFLMAGFAVGFFPAAFAALSRVVQPTYRSLANGLGPPLAFLLGGGALPTALGYMGQSASFSLGIVITGGVILVGSAAVLLVRLLTQLEEGC